MGDWKLVSFGEVFAMATVFRRCGISRWTFERCTAVEHTVLPGSRGIRYQRRVDRQ